MLSYTHSAAPGHSCLAASANFPVAEVFLGSEPGRRGCGLYVAAPDTGATCVLAPVAGAEA